MAVDPFNRNTNPSEDLSKLQQTLPPSSFQQVVTQVKAIVPKISLRHRGLSGRLRR